MKQQVEQRVHELQQGLSHFSGMDWIVQVGEIAEIKSAVLEMSGEIEDACCSRITRAELDRLDSEIHTVMHADGRRDARQRAFGNACRILKTWLGPALPPRSAS